MARRGKGHKLNNRGTRPGTVRGPYQSRPEPEAAPIVVSEPAVEVDPPLTAPADVTPDDGPESPPVAPMTTPPTSRSARTLSLYGVSQVLRVDRAVVQKWIKNGAPIVKEGSLGRGNEWQIDLAELWTWWGEHNRKLALAEAGVGNIDPKDRETLLKVAKLAKLVVPVAVVEALLAQVLKDLRTTLYAVPGRLVRAMVGLPPERIGAFKTMADTGVREALDEFERALCDIDLTLSEDVVIEEGDGGRLDHAG